MNERVFRVGLGTDRHRLVPDRPLMLGGVEVPYKAGEEGHSDGDALLHAITDALLGAAGLGDIGEFFPPKEPRWKGASSALLLAQAWQKVRAEGWRLENIDCAVHLEEPKLLPWRERIISSIEAILASAGGESCAGKVFVKAKTGEGLGEVGEGRAIDAQAVCLLSRLAFERNEG